MFDLCGNVAQSRGDTGLAHICRAYNRAVSASEVQRACVPAVAATGGLWRLWVLLAVWIAAKLLLRRGAAGDV